MAYFTLSALLDHEATAPPKGYPLSPECSSFAVSLCKLSSFGSLRLSLGGAVPSYSINRPDELRGSCLAAWGRSTWASRLAGDTHAHIHQSHGGEQLSVWMVLDNILVLPVHCFAGSTRPTLRSSLQLPAASSQSLPLYEIAHARVPATWTPTSRHKYQPAMMVEEVFKAI